MKYKTYLTGGAVRDSIMGVPCKDLDYVVLAPTFVDMEQALIEDGCKIFISKPEYLTVRANHPTLGCVDFACARVDGQYSDGRRPDSTSVTTDIVLDLSRRDGTCNAMALDLDTGEIIDPFNGQDDIKNRIYRSVGNPADRLKEDKLRAFRAGRFSITKKFEIDPSLNKEIQKLTVSDFDSVSTERIREEIIKMFKVSTYKSFSFLYQEDNCLGFLCEKRGIWFKPTVEEK